MSWFIIGLIVGFPSGFSVHKVYVKKMWDAERAFRRRAQGRR
jgi:hypothetical protein